MVMDFDKIVPYATHLFMWLFQWNKSGEGDGLFIATHFPSIETFCLRIFLIVSIIFFLAMSYDHTANNTKLDAFWVSEKKTSSVDSSEIYVSILIPFLSDFQHTIADV